MPAVSFANGTYGQSQTAILVGRLARDIDYPGLGILLLSDALSRCVRVAKEIAASVIVVDSKEESTTHFYEKFGFISLPKLTDRLFLPMQTAEKLYSVRVAGAIASGARTCDTVSLLGVDKTRVICVPQHLFLIASLQVGQSSH